MYICVKFHENISNGFQLTERTRAHGRNGYFQCSKGNNSRLGSLKSLFMHSVRRLMVIYNSVKFLVNISNGIRFTKRTRMSKALTDGRRDGRRTDTQNYEGYNRES